jgi:hypothetical protein
MHMKRKRNKLSDRLFNEPHYRALAKAVGYAELSMDQAREKVAPLCGQFCAEELRAAEEELFDRNTEGEQVKIRLKPHVRKLCFALLGPAPEQADWYYRHPDGTPMQRPDGRAKEETPSPAPLETVSRIAPPIVKRAPVSEHTDADDYVIWKLRKRCRELRLALRQCPARPQKKILRTQLAKVRDDLRLALAPV